MRTVTSLIPAHRRLSLPSAVDERLYFAQVREDPRLELEALQPHAGDSLVVVSSGGCTALSLLAAGAGRVAAVDLNRSQNHLVELKVVTVAALSRGLALGFLGAQALPPRARLEAYRIIRGSLSPAARAYWDARPSRIEAGVLNAGVTEGFIRAIVAALRVFVHPGSRIDRLLACGSLATQQELFAREWNTARWRVFFRILLNRAVFRGAYDAAFFQHLDKPSFAEHFRARAEHTLTKIPVRDNYFLHHMLTGNYPVSVPDGVPPYLGAAGCRELRRAQGALTLVDGTITDYLRTIPNGSVTGFVLSNICEWLPPSAIDELFGQIARTAAPGARVCFRNFVGWTEVPFRWRRVIVEERALGERLIARDRSVVQRRFAACRTEAT